MAGAPWGRGLIRRSAPLGLAIQSGASRKGILWQPPTERSDQIPSSCVEPLTLSSCDVQQSARVARRSQNFWSKLNRFSAITWGSCSHTETQPNTPQPDLQRTHEDYPCQDPIQKPGTWNPDRCHLHVQTGWGFRVQDRQSDTVLSPFHISGLRLSRSRRPSPAYSLKCSVLHSVQASPGCSLTKLYLFRVRGLEAVDEFVDLHCVPQRLFRAPCAPGGRSASAQLPAASGIQRTQRNTTEILVSNISRSQPTIPLCHQPSVPLSHDPTIKQLLESPPNAQCIVI